MALKNDCSDNRQVSLCVRCYICAKSELTEAALVEGWLWDCWYTVNQAHSSSQNQPSPHHNIIRYTSTIKLINGLPTVQSSWAAIFYIHYHHTLCPVNTFYWNFHPFSSSKRILKSGQNLAKIWPKNNEAPFDKTQCILFLRQKFVILHVMVTVKSELM